MPVDWPSLPLETSFETSTRFHKQNRPPIAPGAKIPKIPNSRFESLFDSPRNIIAHPPVPTLQS